MKAIFAIVLSLAAAATVQAGTRSSGQAAVAAPAAPVTAIEQAVSGRSADGPMLWSSSTVVAQSLPDCTEMDSMYCPVVGARARCYLYQYKEPMVCVCQPGNTWRCN